MSKSKSHQRAQRRAAGKGGSTEVPQPDGTRLDALTSGGKRATEVERSGDLERLMASAKRLAVAKKGGATQAVLVVPQHHMDLAAHAMRMAGVNGSVKNLSDTKRRSVR